MQASISLLSYRPCKWRYFIRPSFYISVHSLFLSNEFLFSFFRFITPLYLRAISSILLDTSLEGNIAVNKLSVYTANSITASPEGSSLLVIFIELGGITSLSVKGDGIPVRKKNETIYLFIYYNNHFLCIIHIRWTSIKKRLIINVICKWKNFCSLLQRKQMVFFFHFHPI